MKEFLLIFRNEPMATSTTPPSPEQIQAMMKPWQDWLGGIAARNLLVTPGNRLEGGGKLIRSGNMVTNGPFAEVKEIVGGYTIIKANSLEEATELASDCPILHVGGCVEVRAIVPM